MDNFPSYPNHPYRAQERPEGLACAIGLGAPFPCRIPLPNLQDGRIWEDDLFDGKLPLARAESMRLAILQILKNMPEGLSLKGLLTEVATILPREHFTTAQSILWAARATLVKLEAGWLVQRVPASHPRRWRLAPRHGR